MTFLYNKVSLEKSFSLLWEIISVNWFPVDFSRWMTDDWAIGSYYIFKMRETRAWDLKGVREWETKLIYNKLKHEVSDHSRLSSLVSDNAKTSYNLVECFLISPEPTRVGIIFGPYPECKV